MKRIISKLAIFTVLMAGLSGCFLKSVHPLFSAEEAILVEGLDGVFENGDQRWSFASDKNPKELARLISKYEDENISLDAGESDSLGINGYLVMLEQLDKPGAHAELFIGMAGEINGDLYLNLKPLVIDLGMSSNFGEHHKFYVNTFSKIEVADEQLTMKPLASSWIRDQIMDNRVRIKHEVVYSEFDDSSEILITASTKELQKFVEKYGKEKDAYEDDISLKRVSNEVQ